VAGGSLFKLTLRYARHLLASLSTIAFKLSAN
jgi:hypothetical protein